MGPPHFHVKSKDESIDAAFSIVDCTLLKGNVDRNTQNLILYWYDDARPKLIEFWNKTRPTNCPVGTIN
jgi:hypothetical protein